MRVSLLSRSFAVAITFICCLDIVFALSAGSRAVHHQRHGHRVKRHTKCSNATTTTGSLASNETISASKDHGLTASSTVSSSVVFDNGAGNAVNGSSSCQATVSVITTTITSTIRKTVTVTAGSASNLPQGSGKPGALYGNTTTSSTRLSKTTSSLPTTSGTPDNLDNDGSDFTGNGTGAGNSTTYVYDSPQITRSSSSCKKVRSTSTPAGSKPRASLSANSTSSSAPASSKTSNDSSSVIAHGVRATTTSSAIDGAPTSGVSNSSAPDSVSSNNSTNLTLTDNGPRPASQGFWAGAGIDTVARATEIEGRVFYDYDGKTVKDPYVLLGESKLNSFRIQTFIDDPLEEQTPDHTNEGYRELNFQLDGRSLTRQTKAARKALDAGLKKFHLTINMGLKIPTEWTDYSYAQMVDAIKKETKRQLQPFLDANIVPDIILFENEGTYGMLYVDTDGHTRGNKDDGKPDNQVNDELCGRRPTGALTSYPQLAGYYKAEAQACTEAITAAGFDVSNVRYGLHSHGQYMDWKQGVVYNTDNPDFEKTNKDKSGKACDFNGIIPDDLLNASAADMLDIMGFSAYPEPMTPTDIHSDISLLATFGRLNTTVDLMTKVVERYGRWEDGPFKGQYKKQALGVEYATNFGIGQTEDQIGQKSRHTQMMWDILTPREFFLGMLWWEPWYCVNNWEGGDAALCKRSYDENGGSQVTPVDTMRVWGQRARSPWT